MRLDLCECGCGEPVNPGKRFRQGHGSRLRGPRKVASACECGCGQLATPGKRFVFRHHSRAVRGVTAQPGSTSCPQCGRTVGVRRDGTIGMHWAHRGPVDERTRCPAGGFPRPRPAGRRVSVQIEVLLPEGWNAHRFRREAAQLLRAHLDEPFVVSLDVEEAS